MTPEIAPEPLPPAVNSISDLARRARAGRVELSPDLARKVARLGRTLPTTRRVTWPGGRLAVVLSLLSQAERQSATDAALAVLRERGLGDTKADDGSADIVREAMNAEHVAQILSIALRDAEQPERLLFASAHDLKAAATEDELASLWEAYVELKAEADPARATMSGSLVAAAIDGRRLDDVLTLAEALPRRQLTPMITALARLAWPEHGGGASS